MDAVKTKLKKVKDDLANATKEAEECEEEAATTEAKVEDLNAQSEEENSRLNEIEEQLDAAESRVQSLTEQLQASEKVTDESDQARKILENRSNNDTCRISALEEEKETLDAINEDTESKLVELKSELAELDEELDNQEERVEVADLRVKELEAEVLQVGNSLRSMEINEGDANNRSVSGNQKIDDMQEKVGGKEKVAVEYEDMTKVLEDECEELDNELNCCKDRHDQLVLQYNNAIAEINEM